MSKLLLCQSHIDKKIFLTFLLTSLSYTFSLFENAWLIIVSAETEYISTISWYRNINFLRDRINVKHVYGQFQTSYTCIENDKRHTRV